MTLIPEPASKIIFLSFFKVSSTQGVFPPAVPEIHHGREAMNFSFDSSD